MTGSVRDEGFGARLRAWRIAVGLTQQQLAEACGISHTYISKLERGHVPPPAVETLHALADACSVDRMEMCRAAKRFPKPITMAELEAQWWLQNDMLRAYESRYSIINDESERAS